MWFQERDGQLVITTYEYGGILARRHIHNLFWPSCTLRAVQKRLSKLIENGYLARPTDRDWRTKPIPEAIYWIGPQGALWLAGQYGIELDGEFTYPLNENHQRKLEQQLRQGGISWIRQPKWHQLEHDLAVVDFRLSVEVALSEIEFFSLEDWRNEHYFRSDPDVIEFEVTNRDGTTTLTKKGICPDSSFTIVDRKRQTTGQPAKARFLLELDGATHSNPKFGRDKVLAGAAYIKSPQYKARFGANAGRWLIVTMGSKRMNNLMNQTHQAVGSSSRLFFFTTTDQLGSCNVLVDPIWWQPGSDGSVALLQIT